MIAAIATDDRGSCILTHRQDTIGRNHRVFQHLKGNKAVIAGGLWIVKDCGQLCQMAASQQMRDIGKSPLGEEGQPLGGYAQKCLTIQIDKFYMLV